MTQNSWNSSKPVGIASGGTNSSTMTDTGGGIYFDGSSLVTTPGAYVFVDSVTGSNQTSLEIVHDFSTTDYVYKFNLIGIQPITNNTVINMRRSTNGGSSWITTSYHNAWNGISSDTNTYTSTGSTDTSIKLSGNGVSSSYFLCGELTLRYTFLQGRTTYWDEGMNLVTFAGSSEFIGNAVQFLAASGNISGTVELYRALRA